MRTTPALTMVLGFIVTAALALGCNDKPTSTTVEIKTTAAPAGAATPATPRAPAPAAAAAKPSGKRYTIEVSPVTLKVGGKAVVTLKVKPGKGLKFNKEFPAKFIVSATKFATCDKPKLSKSSGDVKAVGKVGVVSIPLTGLAAGSGTLSVQASFSVCSDEQCYVLRGEMLKLPVTVK